MYPFLCLACINEYMKKKIEEAQGEPFQLSAEELNLNCNVGITLAPSWSQVKLDMTNAVMGAVAVPTCPVHLVQQTPQQTGRTQSGLLVPGGPN
jgi:hypothetical protein